MINLYKYLKENRKYLLFIFDFILWSFAFYFSYSISNGDFLLYSKEKEFLINLLLTDSCFVAVFFCCRLYDKIWRYADIEDFFYVGMASFFANALYWVLSLIYSNLGVRTYILMMLLSSVLLYVFRIVYRFSRILYMRDSNSHCPQKRMLIIGAGESSASILRELSKSPDNDYVPICIVDDDRRKIGRSVAGVNVVGSTYEIPEICRKNSIDVILFSIYSISPEDKQRILDICAYVSIEVKVIPNMYALFEAKQTMMDKVRHVDISDLLGREVIMFNTEKYGEYIIGKNVLVTGGGGSIGSELCRQIATLKPRYLMILDIYENNAYDIQQELNRKKISGLNFEVEISSIRDRDKLEVLFREKHFDVVFHAAAHKHVPLMETDPEEAVKNNVFGTLNLVELSDKYNVAKFVQISTDKAVNPTNIMGATKRVCEMLVQNMANKSKTEFVAVRFGNVLGSNGSVIPLFKDQIEAGGPVTVTHPDIIRYFMTISEAVSLVLTAGGIAKGGEIFILDMGSPVKIKDLAEKVIRLSGFVPNKDIMIQYTGLRPGEKLYEEILLGEEGIEKTDSDKIYVGQPIKLDESRFIEDLKALKNAADTNNKEKVESVLAKMVPTFKHARNID